MQMRVVPMHRHVLTKLPTVHRICQRENLMDKSKMGATIKAFLSYKTPFWRSKYVVPRLASMRHFKCRQYDACCD